MNADELAKQIPDEVVEAAAVAAYETLRPRKWEKAGYINQQQCRRDARAALAAALNAWEGAVKESDQMGGNWHRLILPLPLPKEGADE